MSGRVLILVAVVVIGAAAFFLRVSRDPVQAWGIYLVNLLFWSGLAVTGPAIAGIMELMEARWSPSVKRIALTTIGFLPVSFVLFVVLFAGRAVLYPWVTDPIPEKAAWLNVPFMAARVGLGVLALYGVVWAFASAGFREGEGSAAQQEVDGRRRRALATVMLFLFVIVVSLFGFDLVMSLAPRWYSGLFGGYFTVSTLYTGFCLLALLTVSANRSGAASVPPAAVQDVAKLVFATSILWMYFFWSQYLVIWYGNVPVETKFFVRRFFNPPWRGLSFVILVAGWLIPFAYLLKRLTGRPPARHGPLVLVACLALAAIFLERMMLVFPSVTTAPIFPFGVLELAITAGFFSLFVLSRVLFLARYRPHL
ncbi:MAG: polysulfide reductase NrfD [Candidatus Rokubacteria bacterium]|nr:polysulfide reductase NrfD [Candidatus Rokubacteria bacterium]